MIVRSPFDVIDCPPTPAGDKYHILYTRIDNDDGSWYLKECGREDIQERINSACPPLLPDIIDRARRGDSSLLGDSSSVLYGDFSQFAGMTVGDVYRLSQTTKAVADAGGFTVPADQPDLPENPNAKEVIVNESAS